MESTLGHNKGAWEVSVGWGLEDPRGSYNNSSHLTGILSQCAGCRDTGREELQESSAETKLQ